MGMIIDGVIIVIFLLCIGLGYYKGLTGSLLKIISFVLALVIAFILFKPIANFVVDNTNWDENLEQAIRQMVTEESNEQSTENKEQGENVPPEENTKNSNMSNTMLDYINETVSNAGTEAKNTIVDATARNIAVTIINVGVLIVLFLISRIV